MSNKNKVLIISRIDLPGMLLAALAITGFSGNAVADDGTGFDVDGSGDALMQYIGDDPYEDHRDFVEDNGSDTCHGCHYLNGIGYTNGFAPGCLTCHEPQWDEEDYVHLPSMRSPFVTFHDFLFGADAWPVEDHPDYVEDNGTGACLGCHSLSSGGYVNAPGFPGPGCLSCHGIEWDGDDDSDDDDSDDDYDHYDDSDSDDD